MSFISSMIDVKHISEQIVKPSHPTPTHLRFLKTSVFDHVNFPVFLPIIFFYAPPRPTTTNTTKLFLDRLRNSFPTTLSVFYPLAGRVPDDIDYIDCNDEGVPYIETQVNGACFENFVNKADVTELDKLLPYHGSDGFTRLMLAIQVNAFPCGGVAICVKISHALSDAFSKFMFVKTWGAIASGHDYTKICGTPYFEISKLFPPKIVSATTITTTTTTTTTAVRSFGPNPDFISKKPVTKWFSFTREKLVELRSNIISKSNNKDQSLPSLFLVISAFIFSRIKFACRKDDGIPCEITSAVNIRPQVRPPSESSYYYGNMFINAIANPSMNATTDTYSLCLEFMDELKKAMGNILSDDKMLIKNAQEGKDDLSSMTDGFEKGLKGELLSLGFSNVRNLPVYEADFGWGKPVWVTSATLACAGTIAVFPAAATSQDVIVFLNLTAQDMEKLTRDSEFLSIVSNNQAMCKL